MRPVANYLETRSPSLLLIIVTLGVLDGMKAGAAVGNVVNGVHHNTIGARLFRMRCRGVTECIGQVDHACSHLIHEDLFGAMRCGLVEDGWWIQAGKGADRRRLQVAENVVGRPTKHIHPTGDGP
jgi:hypothetical protein